MREELARVPDAQAPAVVDAAREANRSFWISLVSNFSTAYNLVNINLAHVVMENQYCGGDKCKSAVTVVGTACLVGAISGQLTFGYVGDCLGRGRALQLCMLLSVFGALVSAFAVPISDDPQSVFTFLSISRLILGVGVGGVYPLAATMAAEGADDSNRGRTVSMVFSMQGWANVAVPLVGMACLYSLGDYPDRLKAGSAMPGISWRLILGFGAVPGLILMPFQWRHASIARPPAAASLSSLTLPQALANKRYWPKLLGCAGGWFLFDITFYGNTLFSPTILKSVFHVTKSDGYSPTIGDDLKANLCLQLLILAAMGLPGYYLSVYLMDTVGRKTIQLQGFAFMAVLYAALAMSLNSLQSYAMLLLFIYGLTYFFSNFGPNSTTFILPSETFPYDVRSSLNGFCAAAGKAGATLGSACFKPIANNMGTAAVFYMCAGCALVGVAVTYFFVDDRRGRGMARDVSFVDRPACETAA